MTENQQDEQEQTTPKLERAVKRVNLRMTESELALLEEVRGMIEARYKRLVTKTKGANGRTYTSSLFPGPITQRHAIVESLRDYLKHLKELERPR